jgi:hypothetical protein
VEHAWCRDPSRDERVRAAEDGRDRPLPTLEQCIEQAKQAAMAAGVKEAFIKSDTGWVPLTREHLRRLEQMIPKSVSASSPVDQENKGCGMGVTESLSADEGGEEMEQGLRTERVTLEITHDGKHGTVSTWPFECGSHGKGVRVVEEAHFDDLAQVAMERDAAIREREALKALVDKYENDDDLVKERSQLKARVAELEAALYSSAILTSSQAASGGGEGEMSRAGQIECSDGTNTPKCTERDNLAKVGGGEHPRGWLTNEEREAVDHARAALRTRAEAFRYSHDPASASLCESNAAILLDLLARSTPPEVVLKDFPPDTIRNVDLHYLAGWNQCMALAKKALAAAGVAVKEVGK